MEIREFAERILFEPSLETKLATVGRLSDDAPGRSRPAPAEPAREAACRLQSSDSGRQPQFPGRGELEREHSRGLALHFFANHELMALELMALALLRFPDAPRHWRKSVVATMRDEQRHARLYLRRMAAHGVGLGDIAANDHFWRIGVGMDSPLTYSAVVGLTLEQANLDFAAYYRQVFLELGDDKTAGVLQQVLDDEVHHVRRGLNYLQRFKRPEQSVWSAWESALPPGLSPVNAKGRGFVVEPRRRAGLSDAFIDRLRVLSRSGGRAPTVWCAEGLEPDLDLLPLPLCRRDDALIVRRAPTLAWLARFQAAGFELPELIARPERAGGDGAEAEADGQRQADTSDLSALAERRIGALMPWRWTEGSRALLTPLMATAPARQATDQPDLQTLLCRLRQEQGLPAQPTAAPALVHLDFLLRIERAGTFTSLGTCRQLLDAAGNHRGSVLGRQDTGLDRAVLRYLHSGEGSGTSRVLQKLAARLGHALATDGVLGPASLRAVVYRDPHSGALCLDPLVAIAAWPTLAHVGRQLDRRVARSSRGLWWLADRADVGRAGVADFQSLVDRLGEALPTRRDPIAGAPLRQGVLATTDPSLARERLGLLMVANGREELSEGLRSCGLADPFELKYTG